LNQASRCGMAVVVTTFALWIPEARGDDPAHDPSVAIEVPPAPALDAQPPAEPEPDAPPAAPVHETVIRAQRPLTAASDMTVRDQDFMLRPHPRPADVLAVTPGLFVVQHAGGGKANQYFIRGFDADHGTDFAIFVDDVPVNLVSHAHGQGYADLNWVIPEVVSRIQVHKGPYEPQYGDFTTAGAVNLVTRRSFDDNSLTVGGGMFGTWRGLSITSPHLEGWAPVVAIEAFGTNGPFIHGDGLLRFNGFAKVTHELSSRASFSLAATAYGAAWNASGQIPQREVAAGRLDRFGSEDPSDGGRSQRYSVYGTARVGGDDSEFKLTAYAVRQVLALYSNFTFFSEDPVHGDQIEQDDSRTYFGLTSTYRMQFQWKGIAFDTVFGLQGRCDLIGNALRHTEKRVVLGTVVDADIIEGSLAGWVAEDVTWTRWLRTMVALRGDYFGFSVHSNSGSNPPDGGVRHAGTPSPKATLVFTPVQGTDIFLNFGMGYHSNDARGVVRQVDPVTPLTRAIGYEAGVRTHLFDRLDLAASFFGLNLGSEIVWVGDEGTTEARGPTLRLGVEGEARAKILEWLFADVDVTWSRATYTQNAGNGSAVALAPTWIVSAGVSARHPIGIYGRLGTFFIANRPATEDGFLTAKGFDRVDLTLGYRHRRFEVSATLQNLLNMDWREAQFANVSRLPGETSPASCPPGTRPVSTGGVFKGCEDVHFTPGAPINLQVAGTVYF